MMTARTGLRLMSMLGVAVALALPAPVQAGDSPPADVAAALDQAQRLFFQGDYPNACKEYLHASELSEGKSFQSWAGLAQCYGELGDFDKAVDAARKARSLTSTPKERIKASEALACALLVKPDAQANAEAAALLKEEMATPEGSQLRAAYFQALLELNHDKEAAEFLHSLGEKDKVESIPCRVDPKQVKPLNERLHAIDPELAVFPVGARVTRPELIHQVNPEMTDESRKHPGFSGEVVVEAVIDRDGRVQNVRVLKGQPFGLSESAVTCVKKWRFKPASLGGQPVKVFYTLTVNFKVTDR